jgi:DNA polymerase (family 10)
MALAAKALGYQYIAITDHSGGRGIAHGLHPDRLRQQIDEIKRLNQKIRGIRILASAEVDIKADGSLDMPEEMLAELDIVVAAIHSAMNQSEEQITKRVVMALENPHVDVISHPTCRIIGEREPVAIDMEAVFRAAAKHKKALEINAMPDRLDLKDGHVYRARELGVKLTMGTDAHSGSMLSLMRFGIGVARRGWCQPEHILNTKPLGEVLKFFRR